MPKLAALDLFVRCLVPPKDKAFGASLFFSLFYRQTAKAVVFYAYCNCVKPCPFPHPGERSLFHKEVFGMEEQALPAQNSITSGVIWKTLLSFFFPILLGTFFQQLYNTADAVIVGRFVGKEALAAVGGATSTLINLLVGLFVGISSGAAVVISQLYGARDSDGTQRAVHTTMAFALAGGFALMIIGWIISPMALVAMNTPADVLPHSITYIRIYFLGIIANFIYNMGSGILRAVGDSRRPLYFLMACCLVNIVLDILLVVYIPLGVLGVALGTFFSQIISAVLVILSLTRTTQIYHLKPRQIAFDPTMLGRIVVIGLPAGLQSVMYSISNIIIQSSINTFGVDAAAAWTAYGKIDGFFWMIRGGAVRPHSQKRMGLHGDVRRDGHLPQRCPLLRRRGYLPSFYAGRRCGGAGDGDPPPAGSHLYYLHCHRDFVRGDAWHRGFHHSHDDYLCGDLCSAGCLDYGGGAAVAGYPLCLPQLSDYLEHDLHLFFGLLLPGRLAAAAYCCAAAIGWWGRGADGAGG